jgi:hypothetical protein
MRILHKVAILGLAGLGVFVATRIHAQILNESVDRATPNPGVTRVGVDLLVLASAKATTTCF